MKRFLIGIVLGCMASALHAFHWRDVWVNRDHQALEWLQKGQFDKAHFERKDWAATAAFRARDYARAAAFYGAFNDADAWYNQGNAWAHLGEYGKAIAAYDQALKRNSGHADALFNRKIVAALQKRSQQNASSSSTSPSSSSPERSPSPQHQASKAQKTTSDTSQHDTAPQPEPTTPTSSKPEVNADSPPEPQEKSAHASPDLEKKQANAQWLRLIPDEPGAFLREKFLRDYQRRIR